MAGKPNEPKKSCDHSKGKRTSLPYADFCDRAKGGCGRVTSADFSGRIGGDRRTTRILADDRDKRLAVLERERRSNGKASN